MATFVTICTLIAGFLTAWNKMYPSQGDQAIQAADEQKKKDDEIIDNDIGPVKPI